MTKRTRRSDDAFARRLGIYRHRKTRAGTPAEVMAAAFDLYRGHAHHVDEQHMARRFVAFVEQVVQDSSRDNSRREVEAR